MRTIIPGLLALAIALAAAPAAADDATFIGAGAGQVRPHFDSDDSTDFDPDNDRETSFHVRVGVREGHQRLYGQWDLASASDFLLTFLTVNLDYRYPASGRWAVLAGGSAGALSLSWDHDNARDTAATLGAHVGVLFALTRELELEFQARQMVSHIRTEPSGVDVDLRRYGSATVSLNLAF